MNKPIIDPSTLTDEQREAIKKKYNHILQKYEHYYANNVALASNVFAGHLEAFEWLFSKEFFKGE